MRDNARHAPEKRPKVYTRLSLSSVLCLGLLVVFALSQMSCKRSQNVVDAGPETVAPAPATTVLYRWTELGPHSMVLARAIVRSSDVCPQMQLTTSSSTLHPSMQRRFTDTPQGFEAVTVCEYPISANATAAAMLTSTDTLSLALPVSSPQRVVVVGDTGCRIKGRGAIQNCTTEWKFPDIANAIKGNNPDLIIHVGDYHYRERTGTTTPPTTECASTKVGYCWAAWNADFFEPAKDLLPEAPWIFARGNHEDCTRAWRGWFYFLYPEHHAQTGAWNTTCTASSEPYRVSFDGLDLLLMDSAEIPTAGMHTTVANSFSHKFDSLDALSSPAWLVLHHPMWGVASWWENSTQNMGIANPTLMEALEVSGKQIDGSVVKMMLTGHIHFFEKVSYTVPRPPLFVFGGGGTERDPEVTLAGLRGRITDIVDPLQIDTTQFASTESFDFAIIQPNTKGWRVTVKTIDGTPDLTFDISKN